MFFLPNYQLIDNPSSEIIQVSIDDKSYLIPPHSQQEVDIGDF